jgi:uncharacterized membrane protein
MKHRHSRTAAAIVATLGRTTGAIVIGASSANAVASTWRCTSVTPTGADGSGLVAGTNCQGSGGGTGWIVLEPQGTIQYPCTAFSAVEVFPPYPQAPYYNVTGSGCPRAY